MRKFFKNLWTNKVLERKNQGDESFKNYINAPVKSLEDSYIFDFKNYGGSIFRGNVTDEVTSDSSDSSNTKPLKIRIKPIDVLEELETIPTPFSCNMLDEKISVLEDKRKLIVQEYAKREVAALIDRLNNRKKYEEFKTFFDRFQNTNDEAIAKLLDKYDLVMKSSDIFIPEFPDDAISIMKEYTEQCEKICGLKPIFYVIAEPDKFREAYKQRDPILLVQSPFGFYWQILGAWDAEMLILGEL